MDKKHYLNLGCGTSFVPGWTNIDFVSYSEHVQAHDLRKGIPYPDQSFDVVYHSHVLEHFTKENGEKFISECFRVLKPGGVIRIAVPDLEQIAINYIKYMNASLNSENGAAEKYEWTLLEMFDQTVRTKNGGRMFEYIIDESKNNDAFLIERNGQEVEPILHTLREEKKKRTGLKAMLSNLKNDLKTSVLQGVFGDKYDFYKEGRFRNEGEIHQWMYDRYSLKKLLQEKGFSKAEQRTAFESYIKDWSSFALDGENGKIRKPDSLFMEAIKE